MSAEIVRARVLEHLDRLRLGRISEQLDALLSAAARGEPTYLDFLDTLLKEEVGAKQRKRVATRPPARTANSRLVLLGASADR